MAPHCAGAALDLTLIDADGVELDMGGAVNGHRTGDENCCPPDASGLPDRARRDRGLLTRAVGGAGFINYPTEWWYRSYGDRYWALITKADSAVNGPGGHFGWNLGAYSHAGAVPAGGSTVGSGRRCGHRCSAPRRGPRCLPSDGKAAGADRRRRAPVSACYLVKP
ncbi:M15 family metallopeptidase [Streptomyces sp. NRRL B-24572]|uniref:M15 family metallopeptidase n=1 Tax=Streptomyces sp. NRRL B-24572 TaxID=1962156 RepID=UPI000A362B62